jgi:hypothetical protein
MRTMIESQVSAAATADRDARPMTMEELPISRRQPFICAPARHNDICDDQCGFEQRHGRLQVLTTVRIGNMEPFVRFDKLSERFFGPCAQFVGNK